jgi:hypothetical protein
MDEISDSLERALDRIGDFRLLHGRRPADEQLEAVLCLQEAVGVGDEARALIRERIFEGPEAPSRPVEMLLGLIVGLLAAQLESERDRHGAADSVG